MCPFVTGGSGAPCFSRLSHSPLRHSPHFAVSVSWQVRGGGGWLLVALVLGLLRPLPACCTGLPRSQGALALNPVSSQGPFGGHWAHHQCSAKENRPLTVTIGGRATAPLLGHPTLSSPRAPHCLQGLAHGLLHSVSGSLPTCAAATQLVEQAFLPPLALATDCCSDACVGPAEGPGGQVTRGALASSCKSRNVFLSPQFSHLLVNIVGFRALDWGPTHAAIPLTRCQPVL